jgi:hypothetical protein
MFVADPSPCDLTPQHLTVEQAHELMQVHLDCNTNICRQRRAALNLLVGEGRYILDAGQGR